MAFLDYCGNAPLFGNRRDVALAPFAAVGNSGWSVDYAATPAALLPLAGFTVSRLGYDVSGTPTRYAERLTATRRVRQAYPNQALPSAVSVALSDYVYAGDTVLGRTNGSAEVSPKPIAAWAQADRTVVGASLTVDVIAFHRNARGGKPVACIAGTASDGSVTVSASATTPIVLGHAGDRNAVIGYRLTFDLSTLADSANVTVNAKVYPWIGGASSVLDSSAGTAGARGFTPQTYRRATALAAAPVYAYVNATTGVDATVTASGQSTTDVTKVKVSATAATAAANPFQTMGSALKGLRAATGVTGGSASGCVIRLVAAGGAVVNPTSVTNVAYAGQGELIVESDPAGVVATLSFGTASSALGWYQDHVRIRNVALARTGGFFLGTSIRQLCLENVTIDNGSQGTPMIGATSGVATIVLAMGVALTNGGGAFNGASGTSEVRLLRGLSCGSAVSYEIFTAIGCTFTANAVRVQATGRNPDGAIVAFNKFLKITGSSTILDIGQSGEGNALGYGTGAWTITGFAIVQNVFEKMDAASAPILRFTGDSGTATLVHGLLWNNSFAGFDAIGRCNLFYDETVGAVRNHRLMSLRGNIHVQVNNKGDVFVATDAGGPMNAADAPNHLGNFPYLHGVGCLGEFTQFADAGSGNYAQLHGGLKASVGASHSARNDPRFTAYAATVSATVAGAGGGDYSLAAGSPCIGVLTVDEEALAFALDGAARARGSVGAYA